MTRPADAWTLITTVGGDAQFRAIARLLTDGLPVDEICALNIGDWELGWTDDGELQIVQPARRNVGLSDETEADVNAWHQQALREDNFGEPLFTMACELGNGVWGSTGRWGSTPAATSWRSCGPHCPRMSGPPPPWRRRPTGRCYGWRAGPSLASIPAARRGRFCQISGLTCVA